MAKEKDYTAVCSGRTFRLRRIKLEEWLGYRRTLPVVETKGEGDEKREAEPDQLDRVVAQSRWLVQTFVNGLVEDGVLVPCDYEDVSAGEEMEISTAILEFSHLTGSKRDRIARSL